MSSRANLERHLYVYVDAAEIYKAGTYDPKERWQPAVWFGVHSIVNRLFGCHVMLEDGAVYRDLPPQAIAFCDSPSEDGPPSQVWECYSHDIEVIRYTYLQDLTARVDGGEDKGTYLFTVCPVHDGFSDAPDQRKEMMFLRGMDGRLLIRPTNMLLFAERSFTEPYDGWPTNIATSTSEHRLYD